MHKHRLLIFLLAFSCGGPSSSGGAGGGSGSGGGGQLAACAEDFWLGASGSCVCPSLPECSAIDCASYGYLWLRGDRVGSSGYVYVSFDAGTFSSFGTPPLWSYEISGKTLVRDAGVVRVSDLQCDPLHLTVDSSLYSRGPKGMAATLLTRWSGDGGWRGLPF